MTPAPCTSQRLGRGPTPSWWSLTATRILAPVWMGDGAVGARAGGRGRPQARGEEGVGSSPGAFGSPGGRLGGVVAGGLWGRLAFPLPAGLRTVSRVLEASREHCREGPLGPECSKTLWQVPSSTGRGVLPPWGLLTWGSRRCTSNSLWAPTADAARSLPVCKGGPGPVLLSSWGTSHHPGPQAWGRHSCFTRSPRDSHGATPSFPTHTGGRWT